MGFVCRLQGANGQRTWLSYFMSNGGGPGQMNVQSIDAASDGRFYISGLVQGTLPLPDVAAPSPNSTYYGPGGSVVEGFVAMFDVNDQLSWRTHLPHTAAAQLCNNVQVAVDADKCVLFGTTSFDGLPLTPYPGGYNVPFQGVWPYGDAFLYEFDHDCIVTWATYYGGDDDEYHTLDASVGTAYGWWDAPRTIALDPVTGDIVICGQATTDLPIVNGPVGTKTHRPATYDPSLRDSQPLPATLSGPRT